VGGIDEEEGRQGDAGSARPAMAVHEY
jgi:hypothetical protein